jgi:hypothetical protein
MIQWFQRTAGTSPSGKTSLQNLHFKASGWISSAQYEHFFIIIHPFYHILSEIILNDSF